MLSSLQDRYFSFNSCKAQCSLSERKKRHPPANDALIAQKVVKGSFISLLQDDYPAHKNAEEPNTPLHLSAA